MLGRPPVAMITSSGFSEITSCFSANWLKQISTPAFSHMEIRQSIIPSNSLRRGTLDASLT